MVNKHFVKTLFLFSGMIILGLTVIFVVSYLDQNTEKNTEITEDTSSFAN